MIFLTVGNWHKGFDRLVQAVDDFVQSGIITEEVVAQIGSGTYRPKHLTAINYCSPSDFKGYLERSNAIIAHDGIGTIAQALQLSKPVVVLPRKAELGECNYKHQLTTMKQLEKEDKILLAYEVSELPEKLKQVENFTTKQKHGCEEIVRAVQEFIDIVVARKRSKPNKIKEFVMKLWPYRILRRDDDGIKIDLNKIVQYFVAKELSFDMIVFIPNAGCYLSELFVEMFDNSFEVNFVTIRRASTVVKSNLAKEFIFRRKWLSNIMRHFEVLLRLVKLKLGIRQKMATELEIDFDVANKIVLVIDDSVDTGTTLRMVKSALLENGARSIVTACISNHLVPDKVDVDYSVYRYRLLRTKNSRDYYAT